MLLSQIRVFFFERRVLAVLIVAIAAQALLWWNALRSGTGEESVILHYNIVFGVDLLGPWYSVFVIPVTGLIFFLVDMAFAFFLWRQLKLLSTIFLAAAVFMQFFFLMASFPLVFLNS